jgi:hypothetical protein
MAVRRIVTWKQAVLIAQQVIVKIHEPEFYLQDSDNQSDFAD